MPDERDTGDDADRDMTNDDAQRRVKRKVNDAGLGSLRERVKRRRDEAIDAPAGEEVAASGTLPPPKTAEQRSVAEPSRPRRADADLDRTGASLPNRPSAQPEHDPLDARIVREIVFDLETTGLDPNNDRIIEIGCVELINGVPTGNTFQRYISPQGRKVDDDAFYVHGISDAELADKPTFDQISDEFLAFIGDARLVGHNAKQYDLRVLNVALLRGNPPKARIPESRVVDTLEMARSRHPGVSNTLYNLCKRYGVDASHRTLHGALVDAELLAEVYIKMEYPERAAEHGRDGVRTGIATESPDIGQSRNQASSAGNGEQFRTVRDHIKDTSPLRELNERPIGRAR